MFRPKKLPVFLLIILCSQCVVAEESDFTYLKPGEVPDLPPEIVSSLEADGCVIPKWSRKFGGVAEGEFAVAGQDDIAVICVREDKSEIRIFWGGQKSCDSPIESAGEFMEAVDEKYIREHYESYGGTQPPPITHKAINDYVVEKASVVKYCTDGKWVELTGAD